MTDRRLLFCLLFYAVAAHAALGQEGPQQIPSPDWRDQIVYFAMLDRFDDGDSANNQQGAGEYNPRDYRKFSGGDIAGVRRRLDYLRNLGATALWITPPVANQWWDPLSEYGGYHGYWARDFKAVDEHFGTLDEYKALARDLHGRGMYLIQDAVLNHTGNFFSYRHYDPQRPGDNVALNHPARKANRPEREPFRRNDPSDAEQRAKAIYHWTPEIRNYKNSYERLNYALGDLDDLNTENPDVRKALRDSYGFWLKEVGVDGLRIDTAMYVPIDFYRDFLDSADDAAPGLRRLAARLGKSDFLTFGEAFLIDRPFDDRHEREIERYATDPKTGSPLLSGMINFPLYGSLHSVFAQGLPTAELAYRIERSLSLHRRPHFMPLFLDNHDTDRFLNTASEAALKQALLTMFTLPGIPVIWQGTEQGLKQPRMAMFASGWGSGGQNHFDPEHPLYRWIQSLCTLRKAEKALRHGWPTVLRANAAGAGLLAYRMDDGDDSLLMLINSADHPVWVDGLEVGWPPGSRLLPRLSLGVARAPGVLDTRGRVTLSLPARSALVLTKGERVEPKQPPATMVDVAEKPVSAVCRPFRLSGKAPANARFRLVVDERVDQALTLQADAKGRWSTMISVEGMSDATVAHRIAFSDAERAEAVGEALSFRVDKPFVKRALRIDPANDDHGPEARYQYPSASDWRTQRQGDIRAVEVSSSGKSMKLDLYMASVTNTWLPPYGFDHVAFMIYIDRPDRQGAVHMPLQNARLPIGMDWDFRIRAHGWSNALFSATGAGEHHEGNPIASAARIAADTELNRVSFILDGRLFDGLETLSGVKLYITTWDYDMAVRKLTPQAGRWTFGGGDGATAPLILDDIGPIELP